jgi:hypothetical protein
MRVAQNVPAILEGWYLGEMAGQAFAEVLFGDGNPSGKLPIAFPHTVETVEFTVTPQMLEIGGTELGSDDDGRIDHHRPLSER